MSCSIIIPTYNRKKFEKLIEFNILNQTYKDIIEVLIADDGDEDQRIDIKIPYPIKYIQCSRTTIGHKRNLLVNEASGEYIAHFDTDDIYFPQFIESSIRTMKEKNKNAIGTSDMIFIFKDGHTGGMRNPYLSMANEATLVYKKSFWEQKKFSGQQTNEGIHFLEGRHWEIAHSNIHNVMICLCHENNTVNKDVWRQPNNIVFPDYSMFKPILLDLGFNVK